MSLLFLEVWLLFFLFIVAFGSTFYILMDEETVGITLFLTMVFKSKEVWLVFVISEKALFLVCKSLQHLLLFAAWQVDKIIVETDCAVCLSVFPVFDKCNPSISLFSFINSCHTRRFQTPWWRCLWWRLGNSTTQRFLCRGINWNMLHSPTFCFSCLYWECQSS